MNRCAVRLAPYYHRDGGAARATVDNIRSVRLRDGMGVSSAAAALWRQCWERFNALSIDEKAAAR
ncbi:hypothetical protein ABIB95_008347 [Bradyrhizobium sp. LA2.1]